MAFAIRRDGDGELCGFVADDDGEWIATTVFGGHLGTHATRDSAETQIRMEGLASLAEHWTLVDGPSGAEQVVCIQESGPAGVTVALDYYSLPGVPTLTISREDIASGRWTLRKR
ncbi:MAG TPA: hypothetical protein VLA29_00250 [Acidimicrobiia bacterium]|nr:hypothetical protein [Acidimicrobiia bacterium]